VAAGVATEVSEREEVAAAETEMAEAAGKVKGETEARAGGWEEADAVEQAAHWKSQETG